MGRVKALICIVAKIAITAVAFFVSLIPLQSTYAETVEVSTAEELQELFTNGGEAKLINDITLTEQTYVRSDVILDLNGYTLNMSDKTLIPYEASLTIEDDSENESGKITSTNDFTIIIGGENAAGSLNLNSGTIDCQGEYCIYNYDNLVINDGVVSGHAYVIYNLNNFTMNGGFITSEDLTVGNYSDSTFVMNGGTVETTSVDYLAIALARPGSSFIMNDGLVTAVTHDENGGGVAIAAFKNTEVTINGGTINAYENAITGNGSYSGNNEGTNAKFNINGGTITSANGAGIYAPQVNGVTTITGGTITGLTGIEVRAGTLNVSGGTITGNGEYSTIANSNGLTTKGAAISIAQHNTTQPIIVNLDGGKFIANHPVSNANPMNHDESIANQISIYIEGGEYTGDNLEDVVDNVHRGYTAVDTSEDSTTTLLVVSTNSAGMYLSATTSGSINVSGPSQTTATDYSEINVLSNCYAGYNAIMNTTTEDNSLYLNSDSNSRYSLSSITDGASLESEPRSWGYLISNDVSYSPTKADAFFAVPTFSDSPAVLRTASSTASENNINDKFRVYFGANLSGNLAAGDYKLASNGTNTTGGIVYQITANPICTTLPIEIFFNQNLDGQGSENPDTLIYNFPITSENSLHTDEYDVTTITLSEKIPTRDDYYFVEWNTNPDGSGTSYQPNAVIAVGTNPGELSGEIILYAIWHNGCPGATICYNGNGADAGIMDNQTGAAGTGVALHPSNFSRSGYGFAGWNTRPDGSGINYGPIQNVAIPPSGGVDLFANWIESVGTFQTWDGAESMNIGDVIALTDERDGETYAVAKLADNNVWIIENFRLDPSSANLTLLNTNSPTTSFLSNAPSSASSNSLCRNDNAGCINTISYNTNNLDRSLNQSYNTSDSTSSWYSYGVLYNWYTATAGNGTYEITSGNVSGDICPAGWHLPTGDNGEFVDLNTIISGTSTNDVKLRTYPNNFIRAGDYLNNSPSNRSIQGRYWSATASENTKAYRFGHDSSSLTPNKTFSKWDGFAVRCIYDGNRIPASKVTVSLGEHVESVTLSNATYGTQEVTTDGEIVTIANNLPYTITATFENGYTIDAWSTTIDGQIDTATSVNTTYAVTGSATLSLTAKAATLTTYNLNYDVSPSTEVISSEIIASYDASYSFTITNFIPGVFGYTFIGWSEDGSTVDYTAGNTITLANDDPATITSVTKTLYAIYQEDSCPAGNICYFGNGAESGTMGNQTASSNTLTNLIPSNYARSGYGFAGWIDSENATPYGPNAAITTPELSTSGLKLYAKWIVSAGDLQNWGGCNTLAMGSVTALTDTRDGNTYTIAKLADNNCWITENLRLNPSTAIITAQNTNTPTNDFLTKISTSSPSIDFCTTANSNCDNSVQFNTNNLNRSLTQSYNDTGDSVAWYAYGVYYNWYTATAGNGTHEITGGDVSGDICPAGWRLPTGNTGGEYATLNTAISGGTTNDKAWRSYPNNFVFSGEYKGNSRLNGFSQTRIWSRTAKDANNAYRMGLEGNKVTPTTNAYNKWEGFAVRCIRKNS